MNRTSAVLALLLVSASCMVSPQLQAQEPPPRHITMSVGVFQYRLTQTGLAPMIAIRGTTPLSSVLMLEAGIVGTRPEHQTGGTTTFLAPEAQLQLGLPFPGVLPYMGLGAGAAVDFRDAQLGGSQTAVSISGSLGVRAWFGDKLGLQVEFRGRGIGTDFENSSSEYTAGMTWRL